MMGFIVIIVIVAVVIVGAMFFMLRPKSTSIELKSTQAQQLLASTLSYTASECSNKELKDIVRHCLEQQMQQCGKENTCDYLNRTVQGILDAAIGKVSSDKAVHGYKFMATKIDTNETFVLSKGQVNGSMIGASYIVPMPETRIELKLYYTQK